MSIHKTIFIRLLSSRFLQQLRDWRRVFQGRVRRSRQLYNTRHHDHLNMPLLCGPEVHTHINDKGIPRESPIPRNVTHAYGKQDIEWRWIFWYVELSLIIHALSFIVASELIPECA